MPKFREQAHLVLLGLAVVALGAGAFYYSTASDVVPGISDDRFTETLTPEMFQGRPEVTNGVVLGDFETESACIEFGGYWNECASACPDAGPDEMCIQVCVEQCEKPKYAFVADIYFSNPSLNTSENLDCGEVFSTARLLSDIGEVPVWPASAIRRLLLGPTEKESELGFVTNIPSTVSALLNFRVEDGVAYAVFGSSLDEAAGSCRVTAIRAQIEKTLTQFPEIDSVVISIEGKTPEESLQP